MELHKSKSKQDLAVARKLFLLPTWELPMGVIFCFHYTYGIRLTSVTEVCLWLEYFLMLEAGLISDYWPYVLDLICEVKPK